MSPLRRGTQIRLALGIEDPVLADRLAALLAGVPGLRLVGALQIQILNANNGSEISKAFACDWL